MNAGVVVRPQIINILLDNGRTSYSFDRAGRLFGAFSGGLNYRRGLDNRVLAKWSASAAGGVPGARRMRRWLAEGEAQALLGQAYADARTAIGVAPVEGALAAVVGWDWDRLQEDAARFRAVYRPISILPPDQYLALVLQAAEGCSYNRCTFCDFYRDRRFRIKGAAELRAHIAQVRDFFGPALPLRRSLFLADANALVAPMPRLRAWLDVLDESALDMGAGLYAFIDAFDVERKSIEEWRELKDRGLRRVYIGMESGSNDLLRWLAKPGTAEDAVAAVAALKTAGLNASVILMVGVGGDFYAAAHVQDTLARAGSLPLGAGDIIYLSPFVSTPGGEYEHAAVERGIRPLGEDEMAAQEASLRAGLLERFGGPAGRPHLARYDIREFIY